VSAALRTGNNNYAPVTPKHTRSKCKAGLARSSRLVLPAMAALGIGGPACGFELGAIDVQSTLGQPLRASIAYALNPGEEIRSYCIYVTPTRSASGLPSTGPTTVVVESGSIRLLGERPARDPLLALQLTVDCPYAAHLSREYVAFVDPAEARPAGEPAARTGDPVRPAQPAANARPVADAPAMRAPIAASTTYRVQPGDTLSVIAQRMTGRSVTIWQAVEALFAANPDAFVGGNRDFLKAGALLRIPDAIYTAAGGAITAPSVAQRAPVETPAPARPAPESAPYSGYRNEAARIESGRTARAAVDATAPAPAVVGSGLPEAAAGVEPVPPATGEPSQTRDIRANDGPFVDTEPASAAPAENQPAAILPESRPGASYEAPLRRAPEESGGAWSWLIWLAGSGIALILALLLGRPLRKRFGGQAELPFDEHEVDRARESAPATVVSMPEPLPDTSGMEVDFHFDEAEADARLIRLDVDVEDGTGFPDGGDIDVAQDFGFSASDGIELGLDVEFPEEPAAAAEGDTNVIPTMPREGDVIVENEVPPGSEETGAYDVSMILDATRQPIGAGDDTTRDLHAIELDTDDAEPEEDPFTLSREVDYKILEQDYQDEMTATQALDAELMNAARDLADRLGAEAAASSDEPTAEFPALASDATAPHPAALALAEADTVEMPAEGGDDLEDTGVNEELKDLPRAVNDATAEMEIESRTVDTKKMKVS
jgi:FimV-like protein